MDDEVSQEIGTSLELLDKDVKVSRSLGCSGNHENVWREVFIKSNSLRRRHTREKFDLYINGDSCTEVPVIVSFRRYYFQFSSSTRNHESSPVDRTATQPRSNNFLQGRHNGTLPRSFSS